MSFLLIIYLVQRTMFFFYQEVRGFTVEQISLDIIPQSLWLSVKGFVLISCFSLFRAESHILISE